MSEKETTLDDFGGWDSPSNQHDFFGETNLVEDVLTTVQKDDISTEGKVEKKEEETKKKEEKLIEEQFKSFGSTEIEDEIKDEKKEDKKTSSSNLSTIEFLKEKGFVNYELEEGQELTEEIAENLLEDSWEASIESAVEETIKDLPQEIKDLIRYSAKGGNYRDLLKSLSSTNEGLSKNSDINEESVQIEAVTADLLSQGHDSEYIEAQIEFLKDSGKLESIATKSFNKIIEKQEAERASQLESIENRKKENKKLAREYKSSMVSHISSLKDLKGIPLTKEDKETLPTYISDPSIELEDGRVISGLQADLFKVMADKDKIVLLAKLLKTDFNFSAIERKKETETARGFKEEIRRAEPGKTMSSSSPQKVKKAVWDLLD